MRSLGIAMLVFLLVSCATTEVLPPVSLDFFVPAKPDDPWKHKVQEWQTRHREDVALSDTESGKGTTELAKEYEEFSRLLRRQIVQETMAWVQQRSRQYYRPDGGRDHWATLGEVIENNTTLAKTMQTAASELADHPHVAEIRQTGMILAIELVRDKDGRVPWPWQERRGLRVYQHALEHGVLLRPLGDVIYFMPPYIITPEEISLLARVAGEGIELATRD